MNKDIIISDLSVCRPTSALSDHFRAGKWRRLPYEAEGFKGVMLGAIGQKQPQALRLPLNVKGWYDIYVALYRTFNPIGLRLRLSSDRAYRKFILTGVEMKNFGAFVDEYYWKAADLTGECVHIAPYRLPDMFTAEHFIAYIRLVPRSAPPAAPSAGKADTRRLIGKVDGWDLMYFGMSTKKDLADEVDVYRNTDFRGLTWEFVVGDDPSFPVPGLSLPKLPPGTVYINPCYERQRRTRELWARNGFDYLRAVRDLTREAGLELYVAHRMNLFTQPPFDESWPTDFTRGKYADYCRHADGAPAARLSFAKRHVQDRMLRMFGAAAQRGIDGVHVMTIRGGPMVMYEPEMIERFRARYGTKVDPRALPLEDERVWSVRAELFGEYLQRLRRTMADSAREAGHRPPLIGVYGLGTREACRTFGLDFKRWAREGIVDRIIATTWGSQFGGREQKWRDIDTSYYLDCVRGTNVELVAEVYRPHAGTPDEAEYYRSWAAKYYDMGIDRLTFWDINGEHLNAARFAIISVLGHKRDLARQTRAAGRKYRQVALKRLAGIELAANRFPPWICG